MNIEDWILNQDYDEIRNFVDKYLNNNYKLFFKYVIEEGIIDSENLDENFASLFQNDYLKYWMDKKPEQVEEYFAERLPDVIKNNDGKYYMILGDISDLSELVDDKHSSSFIESILSGDYDFNGSYYEYDVDALISELNKENLNILIEKIKELSLNKEIEYSGDDDTILGFIEKDGNEGSFIMTKERLDEIIKSNSLKDLLEHSFDDLVNELRSYYNWAYESAEYTAYFNEIIGEFSDLFSVSKEELGKFVTIPLTKHDGTKSQIERYYVNISNSFRDFIKSSFPHGYLYDISDSNELLEYYGSLSSFIRYKYDLHFNFDYLTPSYSEIKENYNEYFKDNI